MTASPPQPRRKTSPADLKARLVRGGLLLFLGIVPLLIYFAIGGYLVWKSGDYAWVLWTAPIFWGTAWIISRLWKPSVVSFSPPAEDTTLPRYWTNRDHQAWQIVLSHQERLKKFSADELTDPRFYLKTAQELATDLSRHYHPQAVDPVASLTVPETLAALRLIVDDLEQLFLESVPGSKALTIGQWRSLSKVPRLWNQLTNAGWAISILINPATALRYLASRLTLGPVTDSLKEELLAFTYLQFIRKTGTYLIEMNSGRLRDGAETFRHFASAAQGIADTASPPPPVKLLLMGQAKAGKSSLINALLGERASEVDVLPCTDEIRSYFLTLEDQSTGLTLLDSPGYSETGLTKTQARQLLQAAREADVILLVMAAHQPAREADRLALDELRHWYAGHPELKLPPVIAVLTHIDRLSPSLEWSPPYHWMQPVSKKEQSIRGAVDYAREVFQNAITVAIPVRTDESHVQGIQEELLPAISRLLPESQAGLMLRVLHKKLSQDRFKAVLDQSLSAGRTLLQNWLTLNRP